MGTLGDKAFILLDRLGKAIIEEQSLNEKLKFIYKQLPERHFQLTPEEQELEDLHWKAFRNVLKIKEEIVILSLQINNVDTKEREEILIQVYK